MGNCCIDIDKANINLNEQTFDLIDSKKLKSGVKFKNHRPSVVSHKNLDTKYFLSYSKIKNDSEKKEIYRQNTTKCLMVNTNINKLGATIRGSKPSQKSSKSFKNNTPHSKTSKNKESISDKLNIIYSNKDINLYKDEIEINSSKLENKYILNTQSVKNSDDLRVNTDSQSQFDIFKTTNDHISSINSNDRKILSKFETTSPIIKTFKNKNSIRFDKSNFINLKTKNLFEDYKIIERIGNGAYGNVYKTKHQKNNTVRAVKAIKKCTVDEISFFNEIEILKSVDHPNIIKLFETYYDSGYYYIVEEYCSGGDLYDYIKKQKYFSEKKAAQIISQVLLAVNHMHSKKIVHRDLKPENIVIIDVNNSNCSKNLSSYKTSSFYPYKYSQNQKLKGKYEYYQSNSTLCSIKNYNDNYSTSSYSNSKINIKLIDFGTSTCLNGKKLTQELGTIYYIAPEVFKGNYDEKCDIWSCGVILFIMLCGHPPFRGTKEEDIKNRILSFNLEFIEKEWKNVSSEAIEFVNSLMTYDPIKRPTAQEALNSSWLKMVIETKDDKILNNNIVENLIKFHSSLVLQTAVLSYLTNQMEHYDLANIKEEFEKIDENKDGVISKEELYHCLCKIYPEKEAFEKTVEIFSEVDFNNDGTISFSEFSTVSVKKEKLLTQDMLRKAFDVFDLDGNGFITKEELEETMPVNIKDNQSWEEIICEVDKDGDGKINFEEFVSMMEKFLEQQQSN